MSILVVGAIHHDVIVETPRLPREDETLIGDRVRYAFGGKGGNQAIAAARMGADVGVGVAMAACLGSDAAADNALNTLLDGGVLTGAIQRVDGASGMSVALSLPDGGYGAVVVSASNLALDVQRIALEDDTTWVVLQNEVPDAVNESVARRAKAHGARVLLNAAPARPLGTNLETLVDVLVVNRIEAGDFAGVDGTDGDTGRLVSALRASFNCDLVVTLGGEGVVVAARASDPIHLAPHKVSVVSTHGAGDMFVGALACELARGQALSEAALFANAAAALLVGADVDKRAAISRDQVLALAQTSRR